MQPTPFGGKFLVLVEEAGFIKKYNLAFLEWVWICASVGTLSGLGSGSFVVSPVNAPGQKDMVSQVILGKVPIEFLGRLGFGRPGWWASTPNMRKKGMFWMERWKLVL